MDRQNKMRALGALAIAGVSILILIIFLGLRSAEQKPVNTSNDKDKAAEVSDNCQNLTYTNSTYSGFSFDYNTCEWDVTEKAIPNTQEYLPDFNSYEVKIKDKRTQDKNSGIITLDLTPNLITGYGPTCYDNKAATKVTENIIRSSYATNKFTYVGLTDSSETCEFNVLLSALSTTLETSIDSEGFRVVLNGYNLAKLSGILKVDSQQGSGDYSKYADELVKNFKITQTDQSQIINSNELSQFETAVFNATFNYSSALGNAINAIKEDKTETGTIFCTTETVTFNNSNISILFQKGTPECYGALDGDPKVESYSGESETFTIATYYTGDYGSKATITALSQNTRDYKISILVNTSFDKVNEQTYINYIKQIIDDLKVSTPVIKSVNL